MVVPIEKLGSQAHTGDRIQDGLRSDPNPVTPLAVACQIGRMHGTWSWSAFSVFTDSGCEVLFESSVDLARAWIFLRFIRRFWNQTFTWKEQLGVNAGLKRLKPINCRRA